MLRKPQISQVICSIIRVQDGMLDVQDRDGRMSRNRKISCPPKRSVQAEKPAANLKRFLNIPDIFAYGDFLADGD
jgi:hypothetical protein